MLQPSQLEPAARELLRQAAEPLRAGERLSPALFLHGPGAWVMLGLNLRSEEETRGCLREGLAAVELHTVDAFMLLVARAQAHLLAPALGLDAGPAGQAANGAEREVALVAASRAGDVVSGTASPEGDWALELSDDAGLLALRSGLERTLLARGG